MILRPHCFLPESVSSLASKLESARQDVTTETFPVQHPSMNCFRIIDRISCNETLIRVVKKLSYGYIPLHPTTLLPFRISLSSAYLHSFWNVDIYDLTRLTYIDLHYLSYRTFKRNILIKPFVKHSQILSYHYRFHIYISLLLSLFNDTHFYFLE